MSIFSERLRFLRTEAGYSQAEFSKLVKISRSSINMYERGDREPGFKKLEIFADFFNVDTDYLLGKSNIRCKEYLDQKIPFNIRICEIMNSRNLRQTDILKLCEPYCNKYGIKLNRNDLSQYVHGKTKPSASKLTILANALGVSEPWLLGYENHSQNFTESILLSDEECSLISSFRSATDRQKEIVHLTLEF